MVNHMKLAGKNTGVGGDQSAQGVPVIPPHGPLGDLGLLNATSAPSSISAGNLCAVLKSKTKSARSVVTLQRRQDWQHRIDLMDRFSLPRSTAVVSLRDALKNRLHRKIRLALAAKLASPMLQLQTTSWMSYSWNCSDVYLLKEEKVRSQLGRAFVSATFLSHGSKAPVRPESVVSEIRKASIFALEIALIELCYGKALEDLRSKSDGSPMSVGEIIVAAKSLTEQIYLEAGEEYGDAVRCCIHCEFDPKYPDLSRPEMLDAVHRGVCEPLEATSYAFCGGHIGNVVD